MPALLTLFAGFFKIFALYAVGRVLVALGLSYFAIQGFDQLETFFLANIQSNYGSMPLAVFQILTLSGVDVGITIIFSSVTVRLIMNGLVNGVIGTLAFRGISNNLG